MTQPSFEVLKESERRLRRNASWGKLLRDHKVMMEAERMDDGETDL